MDEITRARWLKHVKSSAQPHPKQEYAQTLGAYDAVLAHTANLPRPVSDHVGIPDMWCRVADLLSNKETYTGEKPSTEELSRAKAALWQAYFLEDDMGKKAELALIGVLRYGLHYRDLEVDLRVEKRHGQETEEMSDAELVARLCEPKFLEPILSIQHTMPREDVGHKGPFSGCDVLWLLPGEKIPRGYQIKTLGAETFFGAIHVNAGELFRMWGLIGEPNRRPLGKEQLIQWGRLYEALMKGVHEQMGDGSAWEGFRAVVWPYENKLEARVRPKAEAVSNLNLDQAFSFKALAPHWSTIQSQIPILSAVPLDLSNFSYIRATLITVYKDPAFKDLPIWRQLGLKKPE